MLMMLASISISVVRETSNLIKESGTGSLPSEVHGGGWEGLGKDGGEPVLSMMIPSSELSWKWKCYHDAYIS